MGATWQADGVDAQSKARRPLEGNITRKPTANATGEDMAPKGARRCKVSMSSPVVVWLELLRMVRGGSFKP
jgi:hypothetical protein